MVRAALDHDHRAEIARRRPRAATGTVGTRDPQAAVLGAQRREQVGGQLPAVDLAPGLGLADLGLVVRPEPDQRRVLGGRRESAGRSSGRTCAAALRSTGTSSGTSAFGFASIAASTASSIAAVAPKRAGFTRHWTCPGTRGGSSGRTSRSTFSRAWTAISPPTFTPADLDALGDDRQGVSAGRRGGAETDHDRQYEEPPLQHSAANGRQDPRKAVGRGFSAARLGA